MRSLALSLRQSACCMRSCSLLSSSWCGKSSATRKPTWCAKLARRRTFIACRKALAISAEPTCASPSPDTSRRLWRMIGRRWTRGTVHAGGAAKQALDAIYRMLSVVNDQRNRAIVTEIFSQLDRMTEARRSRLIAAEGAVPDVIWLVLLGGAAVTIAFTFFFGMESLRAQTVMTGLLALLIFSELLVVIVIDRPFT